MKYRKLGRTGVKVSPLCLGAMMFGKRGNPDHADCARIIHRALDAGVNFVDTANVYSSDESEEIVGEALRGRRQEVVLATKVRGNMGPGPNDGGNSCGHTLREVENSLRRLRTDYIGLYQIHRPDPETPIEETLRALDDLVRSGKVRYIGSSTYPAWELVESYWVSDRHNLARFECEQPPYSIFVRGIERDVLPVCAKYGCRLDRFVSLKLADYMSRCAKTEYAVGATRASRHRPLDRTAPRNARLSVGSCAPTVCGSSPSSRRH